MSKNVDWSIRIEDGIHSAVLSSGATNMQLTGCLNGIQSTGMPVDDALINMFIQILNDYQRGSFRQRSKEETKKPLTGVGDPLPNGAILKAVYSDGEDGVVLGYNEGSAQPWVTWLYYRGDLKTTSHGHYFCEENDAIKDMAERIDELISYSLPPVE